LKDWAQRRLYSAHTICDNEEYLTAILVSAILCFDFDGGGAVSYITRAPCLLTPRPRVPHDHGVYVMKGFVQPLRGVDKASVSSGLEFIR